jgi:hypothetical protein
MVNMILSQPDVTNEKMIFVVKKDFAASKNSDTGQNPTTNVAESFWQRIEQRDKKEIQKILRGKSLFLKKEGGGGGEVCKSQYIPLKVNRSRPLKAHNELTDSFPKPLFPFLMINEPLSLYSVWLPKWNYLSLLKQKTTQVKVYYFAA